MTPHLTLEPAQLANPSTLPQRYYCILRSFLRRHRFPRINPPSETAIPHPPDDILPKFPLPCTQVYKTTSGMKCISPHRNHPETPAQQVHSPPKCSTTLPPMCWPRRFIHPIAVTCFLDAGAELAAYRHVDC